MLLILVNLILFVSVALMAAASLVDLKTGEIPERISYGFIIIALLVSGIYSVTTSNYSPFITSLATGIGFFAFGFILFLLGQWGGGDVKLVGGVGCAIGFLYSVGYVTDGFFPYYTTYFIDLVCIALPYAMVYGLYLGFRNPETLKEFNRYLKDWKTKAVILLSFMPVILALYLGFLVLAYFYVLIPVMLFLALYLKSVELTALQEIVPVKNLRLGDVVAEDLIIDGKKIASKRDIEGFEDKTLEMIKALAKEGKIPENLKIKRGIKFAPVLFFAMVSAFWAGNFMEIILQALMSMH
jgi:preflagellin peptidase FlaK